IADNKALDERLKGPFKQTLADADVKAALFGIFLEKAPFSAQLKADFVKNYSDALKKPGALSISPAFPQGLREFVTSFDAAIARVGDVPVSSTIIQHLKGLVDPNSTTLNKIVAGFSPGAKGLVDFYMNCRATDTYCDSLVEPFKTQVAILRDAQKAIEQSSFAANCHEQVSVLVGELMNGVAEMDHNVVSSPTDAVLALASKRSQDSVDCLLPGLAASKGFPQDEAARLYQVLGESRSKRPGDREEIVESLHAYLASPEAGGHAQQDLLSKTEAVGRDLVTDFAKRRVQDFATTPSKIARLAQDEGNHKIIDSIVDRMVANTDLVDENTHLPLKDYLSTLAESPVVRGTSIDKAVDAGLQKTLQDPATRRDVLKLALGIDDALMVKSSGLLGPGLERRMVEAYDKADLRGTNPKFAEGTDPGIATFLKGFDKSVKELDKHRASDESALKFFSNMIKPESRVIDGLVAEQSKGASALLMSMLSCKAGSSELCHACLGSLGNWVVIDPKNGTSEVVAKAPMGKILNFIKAGLQGSDAKINATCAAAIPATLDHIFAQPRTTTRGLGILQDPGLFLDALSQAENQTALNCIVANYAETKVFSKVRDQLAPTEAGVRSLLSHVGMPENSGLMQLTGKKLFETLEKKNSNTELLKRKDVLIAALKADLKNDTSNNRHDMAVAMQDLTRSVMVTTIADPELAYGIVKGGKFPGDLKKWAAGSHDALAQMTLQCVDGRYSSGFMPIALYASEDVSRLVSGALTPWVQDGPQSRYPARVKAPVASSDPTQPASNEACTDAGVFSVNSADLPVKAHSSLMGRVNWVGGYEHTLKSYQDQGRADGSALLSKAGETDALSRTADYQKVINHLRQRKELMANKRPSAGYLKWEMDELGGPAKNVVSDLSSLLRFPIDDIKNALQIYKDSPSVKNRDNLNALLTKNCSDIWTQWSIGNKPITFAEPSALQNSH
ncbi:MAG: hypothetical protein ABIR96_05830, partial [Bdellovibrionota bacterium]